MADNTALATEISLYAEVETLRQAQGYHAEGDSADRRFVTPRLRNFAP